MSYKENESDKWVKEPKTKLILDLSVPSLNKVKVGDSLSALSFLGKSDNAERRESSYQYKSLGITVVAEGLQVKELHFTFKNLVEKIESLGGFKSFRGAIIFQRTEVLPEIEAIKEHLGREAEFWDDEVAKCFRFIRHGALIEFIFDSRSKRLREISISEANELCPEEADV